MLFNSLSFLLFFPIVTIVYFLLPTRWRWLHLLIASCVFYMFFIPYYILILFVTILIDYYAGIWIEQSEGRKRSRYLWMSVLSTCLVLFVFKYYDFFIINYNEVAHLLGWNYSLRALQIVLPIGLSFHTFQSLSYVIEVYRGNQKAERHFGIYSLYVMYYPQLVAGPIERPQNLLHQFRQHKPFRVQHVYRGLRLMVYGFFMKLVVADRLAIYVNAVYNNSEKHSGVSLAVATLLFAFQVYADFAGYSSIAIGASRMMGIGLMTNFRRPYFSTSISEFWRRWHISLSTWLRDYLYNPLVIEVRNWGRTGVIFSLIVSFAVIGLWHGANWTFIVFGLLHGIALSYELITKKIRKRVSEMANPRIYAFASIIITFLIYNLTLVYFRADSIAQANRIEAAILRFRGDLFTPPNPEIFIYCIAAVILVVLMEMFYVLVYRNRRLRFNRILLTNSFMVLLVVLILLIGVFDGSQFIYFQF